MTACIPPARFEMEQTLRVLAPGGVMIVDDIGAHQAFFNFARDFPSLETLVCPHSDRGVAVAAFTGARRGEIRGLMWENYRDGEIQITRSIWRGHITEPKTRKSRGAIPVISPLAKRLEFQRVQSDNPEAGVMFPNQNGFPMDLGNLLNRDKMLPEWHGWHAARRGLGTNLYRLGVPEQTFKLVVQCLVANRLVAFPLCVSRIYRSG